MYACACMHVCVHEYICVYACMCACAHACVCMHACVCVYACMHACRTAKKRLSPGFQTVKYRLSPWSKPHYSSIKPCSIVEKKNFWLGPGFQTTKIDKKKLNPKNFRRRPLGIIGEKLHTKFESAAMNESWLKVDSKKALIADEQSKNAQVLDFKRLNITKFP